LKGRSDVPKATPAEAWLPVPGYEGVYEVSDLGRVRSVDRTVTGRAGSPRPLRGKILRPYMSRGYEIIQLARFGRREYRPVHRLVLLAYVGPPPLGHEACHGDGDRVNNRLANLRWGTKSENMQDKLLHGTNYALNKTHCLRGHLLEYPNLSRSSEHRECLACRRARQRARWYAYGSSEELAAYADKCYARILAAPPAERPVHGTRNAYERERQAFKAGRGPKPCAECLAANRERCREVAQHRRATRAAD
jgi:hypothetical protein